MKVRYRSADGTKWVKEGTPGAKVWGIQDGGKYRSVDLNTLEAKAYRMKNNKPRAAYRENGKFLSKKAAEALINTNQFKEIEKRRVEEFNKKAAEFSELGELTAFTNMAKDFKGAFTDLYGFKSLTLNKVDPKTGETIETKTIKKLDSALYELARKGYEGAAVAEEYNKGKSKKGTPPGLFNIPISMSAPGEYLIETEF